MNDKGKTVTAISNIAPVYRCLKGRKGDKDIRCIEIKLRLCLNDDFPGEHGYEATMHAIQVVTDRTINALAEEFLP